MSNSRGSLYKQPKSPYWWASYYVNGKQVRESTKEVNKKAAQTFLANKIVENKVPDKRTISALLDGLVDDYKHNGRRGLKWCKSVANVHLRPYFGTMKADALVKQTLLDYISERRKLGRANATINREMSLLRRAFSLVDAEFPKLQRLAENNVRKGFFSPENYTKLLHHLPNHLKPVLMFAYRTGCRRGEILKLKWTNVDLTAGVVRLDPGETKNGQGRIIPLSTDLVRTLDALPRNSTHVFTFRGKPIKNIAVGWRNGCKNAGLENMLFHDLRRTAVRNLVRSGVSEHVTMSISGHKTRAIFDRYNIVSENDQKDAMIKLEAAQSNLERQAEQKLPGKIDSFMVSADEETAEGLKKKRPTKKKAA